MRNHRRRSPLIGVALALLVVVAATAPAAGAVAPGTAPAAAVPETPTRSAPIVGQFDIPDVRANHPVGLASAGPGDVPDLPRPLAAPGPAPEGALEAAAVPPPPSLATTSSAPPATIVGFDGLTDDANGPTFIEPSDVGVATGPAEVVQVVNRVVRITNRGGTGAENIALDVLFPFEEIGFDDIDGWGDPRVVWDEGHQRWMITILAYECNTTQSRGLVFGAVSVDHRPFFWNGFFLDYTDTDDGIGYLPDDPAIGTSTDKVVIAANEFELPNTDDCTSGVAYSGSSLTAIDWTSLVKNPIQVFPIGYVIRPDAYALRPVVQPRPLSGTIRVVGETNIGASTSDVLLGQLTGTATAGNVTFSGVANLTGEGKVAAFADPPQPVDVGGQIGSDVVGRGPTDAIQHGTIVTMVAAMPCNHGGDGTTRSCVRVTEIDVNGGNSLVRDTLFGAAATYAFHGGIARDGGGALHVVFSHSSSSTGISTSVRYRRATDAAGSYSPAVVIRAGTTTPYAGNRWGDHLGVAFDPLDATATWVAAPHTAGDGGWATRVAQIQTPGADYVPVTPVRLLDTRTGNGLSGTFGADSIRTVQIAGRGGIPANAIAVTGNLTVANQTRAGYVTLAPALTTTPSTSTLNFPVGDVRANNVTVPLSATGGLSLIYKAAPGHRTHLILDITGYFTKASVGATYSTVTPVRLLDTRTANGLSGKFVSDVPRTWQITGRGGVPGNATAITANVTVTGQSGAGYVSLTPTKVANPTTSTINFPVGDNRANGAAVPLGPGGTLSATYKAGPGRTTHLILDITGYFVNGASGKRFVPLAPGRRLDTRTDTGLSGVMVANSARTLQVRPHLGVASNATAVTGNLTVTAQTAAGYVSLTQTATNSPTTSTLNFPVADNRANGVFAPLAGAGSVGLVYKAGAGRTAHLILDVTGYFR